LATDIRVYRVKVTDPDGATKEVVISEDQVKLFVAMEGARPFSAATWMAYCDLWVVEDG
jgi:hypothetical protein